MKPSFAVTEESKRFVLSLVKNSKKFLPQVDKAIQKIAESCAEDVKKVIQDQAFPNIRLSKAWLTRKAAQGLDTRTLLATKKYYDSIRAKKIETGKWGIVCNDLTLRDRLENGTRTMPARPHWGPVLVGYQVAFHEKFADEVLKQVFGGGS